MVITLLGSTALHAADACSAYKWDVSREVQLYRTTATAVSVSAEPASAPAIVAGVHYSLALQPQEKVHYLVAPTKKMLADGAFGGMLKLRLEHAGQYRLAIDSGYWLDVVHDGKALTAADFNGSAGCDGPRKIVVYELPAGKDLVVQIAAAAGDHARLSVTPVAAAP